MSRRFFIFSALAIFIVSGAIFILNSPKFVSAISTPTLDSVAPISACGFNLSFTQDPADPATRFEVQTSENALFSPSITFNATNQFGTLISGSGNLNATTTSQLTGFPSGNYYRESTNYWFRLRSYLPGGGAPSTWSNALSRTTNFMPAAPSAPTILSATGTDSGRRIDVSWTPSVFNSSQYGGYEIWRSFSSDGGLSYSAPALVNWVPALRGGGQPFTTYQDNDNGNNLNPNFSYQYQVRSFESDLGCNQNQSNFSSFSLPVIVSIRPINLVANAPNSTQVNLSWTDQTPAVGIGNETSFEIWRSVRTQANYVLLWSTAPGATSFNDTNVLANELYYYRVRACRGSDYCSDFFPNLSNPVFAITGSPAATLSASISYVDVGASVGEVYLSWGATAGNTYTILRDGVPIEEASCVNVFTDRCRDANVPLGAQYQYQLQIQKVGFPNAFSNNVTIDLNIQAVLKGNAWTAIPVGVNQMTGIGWVKFRNDIGPIKYSVQADYNSIMSGAAWASVRNGSGYGWLSFEQGDLEGCPTAPCEARLDLTSGQMTGWARFLSPRLFPGFGDWDGWLRLTGSSYGVGYASATQSFSGAAWGGNVAGWLAFGPPDCNSCDVQLDFAGPPNGVPVVSNVGIEAGPEPALWCDPNPYYRFRWDYSDPDNDSQAQAAIETNSGLPVFATTSIGNDITYLLYDPLTYLGTNRNFGIRVRASDGRSWSSWVASLGGTTTPTHYYPLVNFAWNPSPVVVGTPTTFSDNSSGRGGYSLTNWTWQFQNADISSFVGKNPPQVNFSALPANVTLTVIDSDNKACSLTQEVGGVGGTPLKRRIFREK